MAGLLLRRWTNSSHNLSWLSLVSLIVAHVATLFNSSTMVSLIHLFIHLFIPDIYIAPLKESCSEALSVQLRPKRNVLRSLQKEDTLFRGSKRNVRGSSLCK